MASYYYKKEQLTDLCRMGRFFSQLLNIVDASDGVQILMWLKDRPLQ